MNRRSDSLLGERLAGPLRWTLLAAVTAGGLALLALANGGSEVATAHAPSAGAETPADAGSACATQDPLHDPAARFGATLEPLSGLAAQELGLIEGSALAVLEVQPDSQASRAGLRPHDVITAIAGPVAPGIAAGPTTSATWDALCTALDERPSGGPLDFFVRRDGRTRIVHVQVEALAEAANNVANAVLPAQTACV